jgi:hypothetical protein
VGSSGKLVTFNQIARYHPVTAVTVHSEFRAWSGIVVKALRY